MPIIWGLRNCQKCAASFWRQGQRAAKLNCVGDLGRSSSSSSSSSSRTDSGVLRFRWQGFGGCCMVLSPDTLLSALHCTALHCTALHCTALHCRIGASQALSLLAPSHCTCWDTVWPALHCTALHCTTLHCTALHCTAPARTQSGPLDLMGHLALGLHLSLLAYPRHEGIIQPGFGLVVLFASQTPYLI
jgi:hypothetical protein